MECVIYCTLEHVMSGKYKEFTFSNLAELKGYINSANYRLEHCLINGSLWNPENVRLLMTTFL